MVMKPIYANFQPPATTKEVPAEKVLEVLLKELGYEVHVEEIWGDVDIDKPIQQIKLKKIIGGI